MGSVCVTMPNFIRIGKTVSQRYGNLTVFKMAAAANLDLLGAYWDNPR